MRDAYAMRLHSVPSRFSHKVHKTPTPKNVFGALFLFRGCGNIPQGGRKKTATDSHSLPTRYHFF